MKTSNLKIIFLFVLLIGVQAQSQELIVPSDGSNFGELEIRGDFLYRGGLDHEIARTDISNSSFNTEVIASGTASEISLRMAVNDDATQVFLNEFGSNVRKAIITDTEATLTNLGSFELEILGLDYYNNRLYMLTTTPQIISVTCDNPEDSAIVVYDPTNALPIYNTHISGTDLYYSTQDSFNEPITYQIFKLDLTLNTPQPELVTSVEARVWSITSVGEYLYFLSDETGSVYRTTIENPDTETVSYIDLPFSGNQTLFSIAHNGDYLYYTLQDNEDEGGIYRIADDVLSVEELAISPRRIYPNPAREYIVIDGRRNENSMTYKIMNLLGNTVASGRIVRDDNRIDVSALSEGLYLIQFMDGVSLKFIKS